MSQRHVEQVIGRLATDEHWRTRYREGPQDALDALIADGSFEITATERRALLATCSEALDAFARALDARIQRLEARS